MICSVTLALSVTRRLLTDFGAVLHGPFGVLMGRGGVFLRLVVATMIVVVARHPMVMRRRLVMRCRVVMMFAGGMLALRHVLRDSFGVETIRQAIPR